MVSGLKTKTDSINRFHFVSIFISLMIELRTGIINKTHEMEINLSAVKEKPKSFETSSPVKNWGKSGQACQKENLISPLLR